MEDTRPEYNEIVHKQPGHKLVSLQASVLRRIDKIKHFVAAFRINKTGYDMGVVKIKYKAVDIVIGTVYSVDNVPKCVSYTYTMISADGEYRPIFINWTQLIAVLSHAADKLEPLEKMCMEAISKYPIYTVGPIPDRARVYILMVNCIIMFANANPFLFNNRGVALDMIMDNYFPNIRKYMSQNFRMYRNIVTKIVPFISHTQYTNRKIAGWQRYVVGHKIVPLSIYDIENMGTLQSGIWRELVITKRCETLLMNGCCGELPITYNWFIATAPNPNVFNNNVTINKYINSKQIMDSVSHLYDARSYHFESEEGSLYRDYINIPIKFAERKLVMTTRVFAIINEFCGSPLMDYETVQHKVIMEHHPEYWIFNNASAFKILLFKYMYGLAAINRLGVIHGDLHLNNVLVSLQPQLTRRNIDKQGYLHYFKLSDIYHIGGKIFLIPSIVRATIIDFSRAIVMPAELRKMTDHYDEAIINQRKAIVGILRKILPEWVARNEQMIRRNLETSIDAVYAITTAVDIVFMISQFKFGNQKKLQPPVMKAVNHLIDAGREHIKHWFKIVDTNAAAKVPNFNREYMLKHFPEFERQSIEDIKREIAGKSGETIESQSFKPFLVEDRLDISGVYNLDNELTYNTNSISEMPEYIRKIYETLEPKEWERAYKTGLKKLENEKPIKRVNELVKHELDEYQNNVKNTNVQSNESKSSNKKQSKSSNSNESKSSNKKQSKSSNSNESHSSNSNESQSSNKKQSKSSNSNESQSSNSNESKSSNSNESKSSNKKKGKSSNSNESKSSNKKKGKSSNSKN